MKAKVFLNFILQSQILMSSSSLTFKAHLTKHNFNVFFTTNFLIKLISKLQSNCLSLSEPMLNLSLLYFSISRDSRFQSSWLGILSLRKAVLAKVWYIGVVCCTHPLLGWYSLRWLGISASVLSGGMTGLPKPLPGPGQQQPWIPEPWGSWWCPRKVYLPIVGWCASPTFVQCRSLSLTNSDLLLKRKLHISWHAWKSDHICRWSYNTLVSLKHVFCTFKNCQNWQKQLLKVNPCV